MNALYNFVKTRLLSDFAVGVNLVRQKSGELTV